jgi:hypothetical protein
VICQNCGLPREDEHGKCWNCKADYHGHVPPKRAVQPRELMAKVAKHRCPHGILKHRPCVNCELSDEDRETYRRHFLVELQAVYVNYLEARSRSEGWKAAEMLLRNIDASEAQRNK